MAHLTYEQATSKDYERKLLKKIFDKIALSNWKNAETEGEFELNTARANGTLVSVKKSNSLLAISTTYEMQLKTTSKYNDSRTCSFNFKTEAERHNFYDSYLCKFIRWQNSLWKTDMNMPEYIPFTGDYSHTWSDEDWMEWFDLTEDEREFVKLEIYRLNL